MGSHNDTVMAMWITDQAIRQGGFQFSFGSEADSEGANMDAIIREMTGQSTEKELEQRVVETSDNPAVQQGYVPPECKMDFPLAMAHINSGADPCSGCMQDRLQCGGSPEGGGGAPEPGNSDRDLRFIPDKVSLV